jgi:release factor glutamine methyltransferase
VTDLGGRDSARSGPDPLLSLLADAGCVAPLEEAQELREAAAGDGEVLRGLVARRVQGEPLAWVTGSVIFAGHRIGITPGVYVPRQQTEALVRRAIELLPEDGMTADLCTGSGALAVALGRARPRARVVATDIDPTAVRCATDNGVEVFLGHLADPLPSHLRAHFDVVTAVVPYVPTEAIVFLPRDVREHEPLLALDGGPRGTQLLAGAVRSASELLRPGGWLLLELGGQQDDELAGVVRSAGFATARRFEDDDGDLRGIEAQRRTS